MRSVVLGILLSSTAALAQAPAPSEPTPAPAEPAPPAAETAPAPPPAPAPTAVPVPTPAPPGTPVRQALGTIHLEKLPEACRSLGKVASSNSLNQALSARISLASCLMEQRTREIALCDCEQSVKDLDAAAIDSIYFLEEAYVHGDAATKILARQALGDMLSGFAQRLLATVPPAIDGSAAAINLRETRLGLLQPLVDPWLARAKAAYTELDQIARQNPKLAKNPAVVAAVRASRQKLQAQSQVVRR